MYITCTYVYTLLYLGLTKTLELKIYSCLLKPGTPQSPSKKKKKEQELGYSICSNKQPIPSFIILDVFLFCSR